MDRHNRQGGMALIAVIAVLIALVLIATPFAIQMQNAKKRAEAELFTEQANQENQSLLALANLWLVNTTDGVERANLEAGAEEFNTPDYDTPDEYRMPPDVLASFNVNSARGRIWDVRIEDEQAKVNVNSAPYTLLANLLGVSRLSGDLEDGDTRIEVVDASEFPEEGGFARIGTELVRYRERRGNLLDGVERGVDSGRPWNSEPTKWKKGTLVMNAAAFEIASYPIRADEGHLRLYSNPYQVKRISEIGPVALDPDVFDRAVDELTCYSGGPVDGRWCNAQTIRNSLSAEEGEGASGGAYLTLDNPRYYGIGTIVRISDETNVDYGIVIENDGRTVSLGCSVKHDYEIDRARVESLVRQPINVNTASEEVLVACLKNVALRLRGDVQAVTEDQAVALAKRIQEKPVKNLYEYKERLREARVDGLIDRSALFALYLNALNPHDFRLGFSTVPFCFKSYDVYTVKTTAVVNDRAGEEIARKTSRRVVSVNPRRSSIFAMESQNDFEDQIIPSRDAKWTMTYPYNTGGQFDGRNIPPSRFVAHMIRNIWPSYSRERGIGDVRLMPERLDLPGVIHYDDSSYAEGHYLNEGALRYSTKLANVDLVDDDGMKPLAVSFWYQPLGSSGNTQYFFDSGEEAYKNRVALFYDAANQEIVLRVADMTLEQRAVEVRYKADGGRFQDHTWYHLAAAVNGSKPGDMSLLVDGENRGETTHLTRLTQALGAKEEVSEIQVEDASSFPQQGALMIVGHQYYEVLEYDGRSDSSFRIREGNGPYPTRFMRTSFSEEEADGFTGNEIPYGAKVQLLGYADPLVTDVPEGGATLTAALGQWHAMKVTFQEDVLYLPGASSGGGGGSGGAATGGAGGGGSAGGGGGGGGGFTAPGGEPPVSHFFQDSGGPAGVGGVNPDGRTPNDGGGAVGGNDTQGSGSGEIRGMASDRAAVSLVLGQSMEAWEEGITDEEALDAFGEQGFAILISPGPFSGLVPGENIGGWEIVQYAKTGSTLELVRYQTTKQLGDPQDPHFVPMHNWGDPAASFSIQLGDESPGGTFTALIPISVQATGDSGALDYLDAVEDTEVTDRGITRAYAQIGAEWFSYTYPDYETASGSTLFVYDRVNEINAVLGLFAASGAIVNGGTGGAEPGAGGGGGDAEPSTPPDEPPPDPEPPAPPPPDPGGEPPPGTGGEDDGGPTGGDTPPPPAPDPGPGTSGEGDGGPTGGDTPPPPPPDPGPPTSGEDDGGPTGGDTPPPPPPDPGPPTSGEDDGGPTGGDTPPPEPPLPPDGGTSGEGDGGPTGGDTPPPDPGDGGGAEPPPDDGGGGGDNPPPDDGGPAGTDGVNPAGRSPSDPIPAGEDVPFSELEIAIRLEHRPATVDGIDPVTVADTFAAAHEAGDEVIPAFVVTGVRGQRPGYGDRVTLAVADQALEELTLQHGFADHGQWVAATSFATQRVESSQGEMDAILNHTVETRRVARILKFPSGELPTAIGDDITFGARFDGGAVSQAYIDELSFKKDVNERIYFLGDGTSLESESIADPDFDASRTDLHVHMLDNPDNPDGLPVIGLPEDGGILRIGDEIIVYEELNTATGELSGVRRGALSTESGPHSFGDRATEMEGATMAVLASGLNTSSYEIELNRRDDFPITGGYVKIGDEILGYTAARGSTLVMPRETGATDWNRDVPSSDEADGGGIFRGRFGTVANDHERGEIVYLQPARFPDRYRERSVNPETSAVVFSKRIDGAIFKRVSWDERQPDYTDMKVFVRFDGTPAWDSDNIYNVTEGRAVSGSSEDYRKNPKSYLYLIDDPHGLNRLDIQADRIEIRMTYQFQAGAYDMTTDPSANSWKDTPWLKALRIEYLAPVTVHYLED